MTAIRIPNDLYEQYIVYGRAWGHSFSEMVRKAMIADHKRGVVTTAHHEPTTREESEKHRIDLGPFSPPKTPQERDRFIAVLRWYLTLPRPHPKSATTEAVMEPEVHGWYTTGGSEEDVLVALVQRLTATCEAVAIQIEHEITQNRLVSHHLAADWADQLRSGKNGK